MRGARGVDSDGRVVWIGAQILDVPEDVTAGVLRARPAHVSAHRVKHRAPLPRRVPVDRDAPEQAEPAAVDELAPRGVESSLERGEREGVRGEVDDVEPRRLRGRQRGVELRDLVIGEPVRPRARVRCEVGAQPTAGKGGKRVAAHRMNGRRRRRRRDRARDRGVDAMAPRRARRYARDGGDEGCGRRGHRGGCSASAAPPSDGDPGDLTKSYFSREGT